MNLKNNKGFAGIDVTIGLVILVIFIPTIFGLIFDVSQANKEVDRKSTAIKLAVDTIEESKLKELEDVVDKDQYTTNIDNVEYRVTFTVIETNEENVENQEEQKRIVSKVVNVKVEYPIGNDVKSIDISTRLKNT